MRCSHNRNFREQASLCREFSDILSTFDKRQQKCPMSRRDPVKKFINKSVVKFFVLCYIK
jgi:hypothetical protein